MTTAQTETNSVVGEIIQAMVVAASLEKIVLSVQQSGVKPDQALMLTFLSWKRNSPSSTVPDGRNLAR
jgi:hypothetical protein